MITIERFGPCWGLRFWFPFKRQLEVWFAPGKAKIPLHNHETVDSLIIYLLGKVKATVGDRSAIAHGCVRKRNTNGKWVLAYRFIPAGQPHAAEILGRFGVFAVWQTCLKERVSPSIDFKAV
jgi:hypothetical protein